MWLCVCICCVYMFAYMWMFKCVVSVCCGYIRKCMFVYNILIECGFWCLTAWIQILTVFLSSYVTTDNHHNLSVLFFSRVQSGIITVLALHSTWGVIELVYEMQNVGSAYMVLMMVSYLTAAASQVLTHLSHGLFQLWPEPRPSGTTSPASLFICCDHLNSSDCGFWLTSRQGNIIEGQVIMASWGPGIWNVSGGGLSLLCF